MGSRISLISQTKIPMGGDQVPLYSVAEAARFLGVANTTFSSWAKGYVRRSPDRKPVSTAPVLSTIPSADGASVPFVTLVEGMVLAARRRLGRAAR